MTGIEEIKAELRKILSEKRYVHSLGVADEAKKLAAKYGVDENRAYIAGLVHDCAKEVPPQDMEGILKRKYGVSVDSMSKLTPKILHGVLGACEAQSKFGIYDPEILDAVKYHTTGKGNMSMLAKIIYIADYIEPNRDFDGVRELRSLAYRDIDEAIIKGIDDTIKDLIKRGLLLHPDTIHARNDLIIKRSQKK
ncbi:MAG: bis(5'-nucleosyl)-tetraphosphatase (symmetrical) YqeK [Clostridiales bacterium]|nr:bis(5'-nucleosyl)-tetraphosphatase (symmetrical) YqeK [Clostridiales bacterium]